MTKTQKLLHILIILLEGIVYNLIINIKITIPCLFKSITNIPCPGCGLTRAFLAIMKFDFLSALKYNLVSIPIFIILITINIYLIIDILKNTNLTLNFFNKILTKSKLIIILLIITEFLNIYHNV